MLSDAQKRCGVGVPAGEGRLAVEKSVRACGAVVGVVKTSSLAVVFGCGLPVVEGVGKAISPSDRFVGVLNASVLSALRGGDNGAGIRL